MMGCSCPGVMMARVPGLCEWAQGSSLVLLRPWQPGLWFLFLTSLRSTSDWETTVQDGSCSLGLGILAITLKPLTQLWKFMSLCSHNSSPYAPCPATPLFFGLPGK